MAQDRRMHVIAGLPRAGSTLLAAILRQNPAVHATITSPVGPLIDGLIERVSAGSELAAQVTADQRRRMAAALVEAYYADLPPEVEVVFDTNRGWPARLPELFEIAPDAKVVCCVRDVAWVLDSLERLYQRTPFEQTALFANPGERATAYTRAEALAQGDRLVGFAWSALKDAVNGPHADRLLLVEYTDLTERPEEVLGLIYHFLDEPRFPHDAQTVALDAPDFDARLGLEGLHRVTGPVAPNERAPVLPADLFQRFANDAFWRASIDSSARVVYPAGRGDAGSLTVRALREIA